MPEERNLESLKRPWMAECGQGGTFDIRHVGQISTHRSTAGMAVEVGER